MGVDLDQACETLRDLGCEVENADGEWIIITPRSRYPLRRDDPGLIHLARTVASHAAKLMAGVRRKT